MRKHLILVALTALFASVASAQTPPPTPPPPGQTQQQPDAKAQPAQQTQAAPQTPAPPAPAAKGWPKMVLTQPPGSNIGNVTDTNNNGLRAVVVDFNTEAAAKDVMAEFDKQLKAAGFTVVSSGTADGHTLSATKGNETVAINARPATKGTAFNISYSAKP